MNIRTLAGTALAIFICFAAAACGGAQSAINLNSDSAAQVQTPVAAGQEFADNLLRDVSQIGSNKMAPAYEGFYSMRQSWLTPPNAEGPHDGNTIYPNTVGDWAFIASDVSAYNHVLARFPRQFHSVDAYASLTSTSYGTRNGYGRGGQCLFYAILVLWRSRHYDLPTAWASYTSTTSARYAQVGDLVYYKTSTGNHIGICVKKDSTGMDLVDSNWVGYGSSAYAIKPGTASSEIIGRHWVTNATIDAKGYKVYSGAGRWY